MTRKSGASGDVLLTWVARLQVTFVVTTIIAFLGFVFADNIANRWQRFVLHREMEAEGLSSGQMHQRPVTGFVSMMHIPLPAKITDAVYSPYSDVVWLSDETGAVWQLHVPTMTASEQVRASSLASAASIALTPDGNVLVAVPEAGHIVTVTVMHDSVTVAHPIAVAASPFAIATDVEGTTYVLNDANVTELIVSQGATPARVLYARPGLHAVAAANDRIYLAGQVYNGRPFVQLSKNGVDMSDSYEASRLWALPYWDVPFVDITVDEHHFLTLLDENGYVIRLDPRGTAILQLPSREYAAQARALVPVFEGLLVVYEDAVELLQLNTVGHTVEEAAVRAYSQKYEEAIGGWHDVLADDPRSGVARRLLGDAYLASDDPVSASRQYFYSGQRRAFNEAISERTKQVRQDVLWTPLVALALLSVVLSVIKLLLTSEPNGDSK